MIIQIKRLKRIFLHFNIDILFFTLFLFSCGDSGSSTQPSTQQQTSFLPSHVNNTQLKLKLNSNNNTIIKEDLPEISDQFNHYFGNGDLLYLQTDKSTDWQYRGSFNYIPKSNNNAEITIKLITGREYILQCQFINNNSGTCNSELEDTAFPSGSSLAVTLYLSGASRQGNNNVVQRFKNNIEARDINGLTLFHQTFNVIHEQVSRPSILNHRNPLEVSVLT